MYQNKPPHSELFKQLGLELHRWKPGCPCPITDENLQELRYYATDSTGKVVKAFNSTIDARVWIKRRLSPE